MRTLRSADLVAGLLLMALGLLALQASVQIAGTAGERVHPRTFPMLLSAIVVVGGTALAVGAWRQRDQLKVVDWPQGAGKRRVLVTTAGIATYMALLEPLGFPLATLVFVSFSIWYLGRYRWWGAALGGLASAVVILFVFVDLLSLSFPMGLLELLF